MMLHWSHEGTDCAGCHSPVSVGQHRMVVGHAVWHEACWLRRQPAGVALLSDWLR